MLQAGRSKGLGPDEVNTFFFFGLLNASNRTMALGFT
jgi:hypothetical protein